MFLITKKNQSKWNVICDIMWHFCKNIKRTILQHLKELTNPDLFPGSTNLTGLYKYASNFL